MTSWRKLLVIAAADTADAQYIIICLLEKVRKVLWLLRVHHSKVSIRRAVLQKMLRQDKKGGKGGKQMFACVGLVVGMSPFLGIYGIYVGNRDIFYADPTH